MSVIEEFFQDLEARGIPQAQAARELGCSPGLLSQLKTGTYGGDAAKWLEVISNYLERERNRSTILEIPIVETSLLKQIQAACDIAYDETDISVITGPAGCGKSEAFKAYVRKHQDRVYYLEANKATTPHVLVMRLAELLNLSMKGNASDVTNRIWSFLQGRDTLVIIDQADDLSDHSLEYLRQIVFDAGQTGLVLAGLPKLAGQIMNARNDHDQLLSRVGLYLRLPAVETSEMSQILHSVWPLLDQEVEQVFLSKSTLKLRSEYRPSLRRLTKIMKRANKVMVKNRLEQPTAEIVEHAAQYIMNQEM
ncbi:MAG TPA: AAA family ATPase [Rectinemataceae bacterium]|nr:AAA family ATPase [Rectinemataceae bacterium]